MMTLNTNDMVHSYLSNRWPMGGPNDWSPFCPISGPRCRFRQPFAGRQGAVLARNGGMYNSQQMPAISGMVDINLYKFDSDVENRTTLLIVISNQYYY